MTPCRDPEKEAAEAEAVAAAAAGAVSKVRSSSGLVVTESLKGLEREGGELREEKGQALVTTRAPESG